MISETISSTTHCESCGLRPFERNRYFDGKLLVTPDFQVEQLYLRGKDRLHSSMLHGEGAVCGLKIERHPSDACAHQFVVLNPGLALDCCGNEIIVHERTVLDLREMIESSVGLENLVEVDGAGNRTPVPTNVYIRAAYQECDTQMVPALLDDCHCDEYNTEHNRTRESYRVFVNANPPVSEGDDPLNARLEWQHTLAVRQPRAMVVDRNLMRLYVAEWDGAEAWLRLYDASNHRLIQRVSAGTQEPTALARSNQGNLVFLAQAPESGGGTTGRIAIFDQARLENDPDNALRVALAMDPDTTALNLQVSPLDDSLYVLTDTGRVLRWRSGPIHDAVNTSVDGAVVDIPVTTELEELGAAFTPVEPVSPTTMAIGPDGRWLVVAESGAERLFALNLSQFGQGSLANRIESFTMPAGDSPAAVRFSYDGDFLYILCAASQKLFRASIRTAGAEPELVTFIPDLSNERDKFTELILVDDLGLGSPPNSQPLDLAVTPRDNWAYILRREFDENGLPRDRGDILTINVDGMNNHLGQLGAIDGVAAQALRRQAANTSGNPLFQELALLGQRLYVAGETLDDAGAPITPVEGSVSILFITEGSCDAYIHQTVEGCPECLDPSQGVVIASIQGYVHNEPMLEEEGALNYLDNHSHRQLAPSTNTLLKVIQCMLDKGISEGIPGPRGPVGAEGIRGAGITSVEVDTLSPGTDATAALEDIPGDLERDQILQLGIPRGRQGVRGDRGPGIADVSVTPLDAGLDPAAMLVPIAGDANDDLRLELSLAPGAGITAVQALSGPLAAVLEPIDVANPDGDQRLILTIPAAVDGTAGAVGPRGPGVTDVALTMLDVEDPAAATASLTEIAGGDYRLDLELPRGATGEQGEPGPAGPAGDPGLLQEFNHVVNASWHLDEVIALTDLAGVSSFPLDVEFEKPVLAVTLHDRSAFVLARWIDDGMECECRVPAEVTPLRITTAKDRNVDWLVGNDLIRNTFGMIDPGGSAPTARTDPTAIGVRIMPANDPDWTVLTRRFDDSGLNISRMTISVVLRGDWIMYEPELFRFSGITLANDPNQAKVPADLVDAFDKAPTGIAPLDPNSLISFDAANDSWLVQDIENGVTYIIRQDASGFIVSGEPRALDGNHIWPGVPSRPSGNGTQGNDWISALHLIRTAPAAGALSFTLAEAGSAGMIGLPGMTFVAGSGRITVDADAG